MYKVDFVIKHAELDSYANGCDPFTSYNTDVSLCIEAPTVKQLFERVCRQFGVDDSALLLNSCDEIGRLDVLVYENAEGEIIESAINDPESVIGQQWRNNELKAWLCTYTGDVTLLTKVNLDKYKEVEQ